MLDLRRIDGAQWELLQVRKLRWDEWMQLTALLAEAAAIIFEDELFFFDRISIRRGRG